MTQRSKITGWDTQPIKVIITLIRIFIEMVIFSGQSYIELQTMRHVEHKTSIYIEFKTHRYDGQLLYTEQV